MTTATPTVQPWKLYSRTTRWAAFAMLCVVTVSATLDRTVFALVLEPIKQEFGLSDMMLGLLTGFAFSIFYATLGIPIATLSDRGDRRLIIAASVFIWSVMTALCGLAQNIWQLLLVRIGVGAGEAGATPPVQSLLADYFQPEQRARAISFYMIATYLAAIAASVGGARLAELYGWRMMLVLFGVPGLVLAPLAFLTLDEPRRRIGFPKASGATLIDSVQVLIGKRSYVLIVAGFTFYYLMAYGSLGFLAVFLIRVHHLSLTESGTFIAVVTSTGASLGSLFGGSITDRLGRCDRAWFVWLPGCGMFVCCPIFLAAFSVDSMKLMWVLFILGYLLLMSIVPPLMCAIHAVCGSTRRAMAFAIHSFAANLV